MKMKTKELESKLSKESEPKKRVAVLFSSGLDSTYLLWKNLEEGNEVTPIYIEIKNNENKTKIEKQNVEMLCELFREKYGYRKITQPLYVAQVSIINGNHDLMFSQLPIWIFSLVYIPIHRIDEIQIGYVLNDDAISYVDEIKKFYKSHAWLQTIKQPKLVFPLIKDCKDKMMREIPQVYMNYISSCENPKLLPYHMHVKGSEKKLQFYRPCGECVPCKRIIRDHLDYNFLYRQMICEHYEKFNLGVLFYDLKKAQPETYDKIIKIIDNDNMIGKLPVLDKSYTEERDEDAKVVLS